MSGVPAWVGGVEFSDDTKMLVVARQQAIPGAGGPPLCPCCGEAIQMRPDFHHRKRQRRHGTEGDGRPSNCLAVHGRLEGEQCHFRFIHNAVASARANGWIILSSAPLRAYRMPVLVNFRQEGISPGLPWVVLDDHGGWRQAKPSDMAGDYDWSDS